MRKRIMMLMLAALLAGGSVLLLPESCEAKGSKKETEERTPVIGNEIPDGSYQIEVESSSSMFRVVEATLRAEKGELHAVITLSGKGYPHLYMGTADEAAKASESDYIPYQENENGMYTYEVPVEALDQEIDCAGYSRRKEKWYDRTLVFLSDSLPPRLEDGRYTVEVLLQGGSGKAKLESPTELIVKDSKPMAVITWSSPNYDYMKLDQETYYPVNTEGNAVFQLPVTAWDQEISVIADTTAMSTPHEITYTLTFVQDSVKAKGVKIELMVAAAGIVLAAAAFVVGYTSHRKKRGA